MLGQPISMLLPQVIGFRLTGELPEGATATDLVLTVTEMLREHGVVGEVRRVLRPRDLRPRARRPGDDRQHVARVRLDLRDLPGRRRDAALPRVHRPARPSRSSSSTPTPASRASSTTPDSEEPTYSDTLELDLGEVEPSIAGPKRPQDRIAAHRREAGLLRVAAASSTRRRAERARQPRSTRPSPSPSRPPTRPARTTTTSRRSRAARARRRPPRPSSRPATRSRSSSRTASKVELDHGHVVIAAITSCTNTSNPSVMVGAGLLAQEGGRARPRRASPGSRPRSRPGSIVVTDYLEQLRPRRVPRQARVQPRRLRLHDLHRQLRAAAGGRSPRRSTRRTSSSARCSRATATSRAGSTPTRATTTSPRRRCASPTRSPGAWTST